MPEPRMSRSQPLVLVVDDEHSARLIMRATLEESGFEVLEASCIAEAAEQFARHDLDLIILDVILPDGNGIQFCSALRQLPRGQNLPIAMATGLDDVQSIQLAYQSGATDFITKPISWGTLGYRVRYLLRAHHAFGELALSESKTRALLSALPDLLFHLQSNGLILDRQAGNQAPDWGEWDLPPGTPLLTHLDPKLGLPLQLALQESLERQQPCTLELSQNSHCWEARIRPRGKEEALLVVRDISLRKQMENQLRLSAQVFESSNEAILITDQNNRIISVNPMFERITGYRADEVTGTEATILTSGLENPSVYRNLWAIVNESGSWQGEVMERRKSGELYPASLSVSLVRNHQDQVEYHIASFADITERKRQEAQIEHLAFHDPLTGLPNRRLLIDRIQVAIAQAERDASRLAILFVDLDRFKNINDSLGHQVGDQLLREVGKRLKAWVRTGDTVSRVGGDEFIVLCPNCSTPSDASSLGDKLLQAISLPYLLADTELVITASIGIALCPDNGRDANTLIGNADIAMYLAKENDRNNYQFYSPELNARNMERLRMELRLRHALEAEEFQLYFQPQIDSQSGAIIGAEALIRWLDPEQGLIPPGRFIPLAEETGQIQAIGDWVLRQSCSHLLHWKSLGLPEIPIAINLSARQFRQPSFVDSIGATLREYALQPHLLELELTESMLMKDIQLTTAKLKQLKNMGFRISIDDFGTGFSSLNYLRHFPLDVLKIDQSFVRELLEDDAALAIIQSIIALAGALGLRTVAEGVETLEQQALLQDHGCSTLQGYLISRPLPEAEFIAWVRHYLALPI